MKLHVSPGDIIQTMKSKEKKHGVKTKVPITASKETKSAYKEENQLVKGPGSCSGAEVVRELHRVWSEKGTIVFPKVVIISALTPWFDLHPGSMRHLLVENLMSSLRSIS